MLQKILTFAVGIAIGAVFGYLIIFGPNLNPNLNSYQNKKEKLVIGFLPFWLIDKAQPDYSKYITELSYFNLVLDSDGSIQKFTNPGESDPGYHALSTGKIDDYLVTEKGKGVKLSLTVFSGNNKKIDALLTDPQTSAQNLVNEVTPIIYQYGFSDLNLDIEKPSEASPEARIKYTQFVTEVRKNLDKNITITVDLSPIAFVKDTNIGNPAALAGVVDRVVLMGYDFHNPGSIVTGPVAPQTGAGIVNEFDIESAVQAASLSVPPDKLILAIPLYGYSWETIHPESRSATIPASAYSISNKLVEDFLLKCATCSATFDKTDEEPSIVYEDTNSNTYHQIFYPNQTSTQIKINFAKNANLAGIALWALGYEGNFILEPLASYYR